LLKVCIPYTVNNILTRKGLCYNVYDLAAISVFVATITFVLGSLRSSSNLHFKMLHRILRAPMHFFDTTPIGRIVNRFAKDVDVCDATLPFNLRVWIISVVAVLGTLAVISFRYYYIVV
jgi:ATP-binding cassette subfamily C (CFTR/MRP) protein 1